MVSQQRLGFSVPYEAYRNLFDVPRLHEVPGFGLVPTDGSERVG